MARSASFLDVVVEVPAEAAELLSASAVYSFHNLETEHPTLTIGRTTFEGQYFDIVGTNLLFDPARKHAAGYIGAATKRLVFHRVERANKGDEDDDGEENDSDEVLGRMNDTASVDARDESGGADGEKEDHVGDTTRHAGGGTGTIGSDAKVT